MMDLDTKYSTARDYQRYLRLMGAIDTLSQFMRTMIKDKIKKN